MISMRVLDSDPITCSRSHSPHLICSLFASNSKNMDPGTSHLPVIKDSDLHVFTPKQSLIREKLKRRREQHLSLETSCASAVQSSGDPGQEVRIGGRSKLPHLIELEPVQPSPNGIEEDNVESLLSLSSTRERENKKVTEEIFELLSKPSVKEKCLIERFRSVEGGQVQQFCIHGTRAECSRLKADSECDKLHFKKIIQKHTDESLGDCSFLNTCFRMECCKYVHYQVDSSSIRRNRISAKNHCPTTITDGTVGRNQSSVLVPPQWIQCDLRHFDVTVLGKFSVVMADPPWDIHMELPYGTMSDDEMRALNIPCLQDEGLIFLWVTGRAMELGRECLTLWGYERCDEILWVKTNQLQRIIRTGRTGHWLNHGKEHCLVGVKGNPKSMNRGLDCDVIVAEVRATSHKPDEIYGIIERLSPGTRKIELFGRPHNVQPNWITLGNQLDGVHLLDHELIANFKKTYPSGNCIGSDVKSVIK